MKYVRQILKSQMLCRWFPFFLVETSCKCSRQIPANNIKKTLVKSIRVGITWLHKMAPPVTWQSVPGVRGRLALKFQTPIGRPRTPGSEARSYVDPSATGCKCVATPRLNTRTLWVPNWLWNHIGNLVLIIQIWIMISVKIMKNEWWNDMKD